MADAGYEAIKAWKEAYEKVFPERRAPAVIRRHSWYEIDGYKYRRADLEMMAGNLRSRIPAPSSDGGGP